MKRNSLWNALILVGFILPMLLACGSDDEGDSQNTLIDASFSKVKSQIIGTWVYEAEYKKSINPDKDLGGIYNKLGWNERDPYKSLTFKTDGIVIKDFYGEQTLSYNLKTDYSYKNHVEDSYEYYPFKNGGVILSYGSESYFVDIVNGKLILYDTYDGAPKERYKMN